MSMKIYYFSEYSEGSSYNKYLETYNPSSNTVSLENYALALVVNDPAEIGVYDSWHYFDIIHMFLHMVSILGLTLFPIH